MMTPQDFIEQSNFRGFAALGRDWIAIFATVLFSIWADNFFVYLACVWIIGTFQYAIGEVLLHEASHYHLFKNRKLNDYLKVLYTYPFFVTMPEYRFYHKNHHYKMNTELDHVVEDYEIQGLNNPNKNMFWLWFVKPITGFGGYFYLRYQIRADPMKHPLQMLLFWVPVVAVFAYFGRLDILLFYWIVPLFWVFSSHLYWSEIAKHYNTETGTRSDLGIKNHIFHNAGYHSIHHQYPSIPWYLLPKAHRALCKNSSDISRGFIDTYKQLKKNLNSK